MKGQKQFGGIRLTSLSKEVVDRLLQGVSDDGEVALRPGAKAIAVMYVPANLVNGDTIVVGADTFEVDIINTDSGVNTANDDATGPLNGTDAVSLVTVTAAPGTVIDAGALLRIENEILKVLRKISTTQYVCARGRCGTTIATHVKNTDVFVSDAAPASNIPVGLVATLTPAVFGPAFVEEFNNAIAGGERATAKASTEYANFTAVPGIGLAVGQEIVLIANEPGVDLTATTEDFANSTDNVWGAATFTGGLEPASAAQECVERVPTASEELVGEMHFAFPFTVRAVLVQIRITATGQQLAFTGSVQKGYVESTDATLPSTVVTLRNLGPASTAYIQPFAATHTVTVLAFE